MKKLALILLTVVACVDHPGEELLLQPAPQLLYPTTWSGVIGNAEEGEPRQAVLLMTPEEHQKMRADIQRAHDWMRRAEAVLREEGRIDDVEPLHPAQ